MKEQFHAFLRKFVMPTIHPPKFMNMKNLLSFLLLLVVATSCCTYKITPDHYKGGQLVFGKGGGFTGRYEYFTLLQNGNIFAKNGADSSWKLARVIGSQKAKSIFELATNSNIATEQLNTPGNMTYFIDWKSKKGTTQLKWGGGDAKLSQAAKDLYSQLYQLVKQ